MLALFTALLLTGAPTEAVKSGQASLAAAKDRASLEAAGRRWFDAGELLARAVGNDALSKPQTSEAQTQLSRLLAFNWARRARQLEGQSLSFHDESVSGALATVKASLGELPVHFALVRSGGRWRVYDVTVDGSSALEAWREELQQLLKEKGPGAFVTALTDKANQLAPAKPNAPRPAGQTVAAEAPRREDDPFEQLLFGATRSGAPQPAFTFQQWFGLFGD